MKTKSLLLIVALVLFCGACEEDAEFYGAYQQDDTVMDGCSRTTYVYDGTPIAGDPDDAYMVDFSKVENTVNVMVVGTRIDSVSHQLTQVFSNPYEKVYAIYYWMTITMKKKMHHLEAKHSTLVNSLLPWIAQGCR